MTTSTRPSRTEIAEGLGALFVIAVGLLGSPLLATIVGWPLPHHLPTGHALGSRITDPRGDSAKALAVIAWLAWGTSCSCHGRTYRCDLEPPPCGHGAGRWKSVRWSSVSSDSSHPFEDQPRPTTTDAGVMPVVDASPAPDILLSASHPTVPTYTGPRQLWDIAESHYGNGQQRHSIYDANVGNPDQIRARVYFWEFPPTGLIPIGSSPFLVVRHRTGADSGNWGRYFGSRNPVTYVAPGTVCGAS